MAVAKTKAMAVLHRVLASQGYVTYAGPETEARDGRDVGSTHYSLSMTEEAAGDLSHPDTVTITVEPGDRLNP